MRFHFHIIQAFLKEKNRQVFHLAVYGLKKLFHWWDNRQ